ncbi:MAG TPA: hypothetical protein VF753_13010 [Terriglobales bacterium]
MRPFLRLSCYGVALILTGCGSAGYPHPPSLDLPQPPTDLRIARKGDRVYLAWTVPTESTDSLVVKHPGPTDICRSVDLAMKECGVAVGQVAAMPAVAPNTSQSADQAKAQATYTDPLGAIVLSGNPEGRLFYSVSAMNANRRSAGLSNIVSVSAYTSTLPPSDFQARLGSNGVTLSWTGVSYATEPSGVTRTYRVYRREQGKTPDFIVGEIPYGTTGECQLVDQTFEWEMKYDYRVTVVTKIELPGTPASQFDGDDSAIVQVVTHDVFPPAVPSGLQAVFSGAGQQPFIDLVWAPVTDADLAGYNVYRHEAGGSPVKINETLVKPPAFRDNHVASGHIYTYMVTAVDLRGNESAPSGEASESVP